VKMNRLRNDRVLVDLADSQEEKKDIYDQTEGGIFIPEDKKKEAFLTKGVILKVGHEINPQDLREGDVVYVKKFQGERLSPTSYEYLFREKDIVGND
jgi:co-chaperonin GroES (HSP10)